MMILFDIFRNIRVGAVQTATRHPDSPPYDTERKHFWAAAAANMLLQTLLQLKSKLFHFRESVSKPLEIVPTADHSY